MKDIFNFADEELNEVNCKKISQEVEKELEDKIRSYSNMSTDELTSTLFENIGKQKKDGSFDYEKLASMAKSMFPYLKEDQKRNIEELLNKIR